MESGKDAGFNSGVCAGYHGSYFMTVTVENSLKLAATAGKFFPRIKIRQAI
jgi:hypothetical protein